MLCLSRRFATAQVDQCVTVMSLHLPVPSGIPAWTRVSARSAWHPTKLVFRADVWTPDGLQWLRDSPQRWTAAELEQIFSAPATAHLWHDVQHLTIDLSIDTAFLQASHSLAVVILQLCYLLLLCCLVSWSCRYRFKSSTWLAHTLLLASAGNSKEHASAAQPAP
jgi:hypothetical protein